MGKLIVAVDEKQTAKIEGIARQGEINGVEGLEFLGGNAARAMEPALDCVAGAALAGDRHHRQPRLHAGAGRRSGRPRRHDRVQHAGRAAGATGAGLGGALWRRRSRHAHGRCGGQFGRPRRADDRARDGGLSPARVPRLVLAKGNYFGFTGQAGVLASDLSGAGRGRARHACDARSWRAACASAPTSNGSSASSYTVDPRRADSFYPLIPHLELGMLRLERGRAGLRVGPVLECTLVVVGHDLLDLEPLRPRIDEPLLRALEVVLDVALAADVGAHLLARRLLVDVVVLHALRRLERADAFDERRAA